MYKAKILTKILVHKDVSDTQVEEFIENGMKKPPRNCAVNFLDIKNIICIEPLDLEEINISGKITSDYREFRK